MIKSHVLYRLSYALTFRSVTMFQAIVPFQLLLGHDPAETRLPLFRMMLQPALCRGRGPMGQ
jgi:hypothetical protein